MFVDVITERGCWNTALRQIGSHDFMHTFDFHKASQNNSEGLPIMFALKNKNKKVVANWSVLKRIIPGTDFFDFTSVYGYGGPIFEKNIDKKMALNLIWGSMREFGAVSLFSRMHPLFIEEIPDENLRGQRLSDVVVIEVESVPNILDKYRGSHRREIIKARATGIDITVDFGCESLVDFIEIYQHAMQGLHANNYYYFNNSYFEALKNSNEFKMFIIFAEIDGKKVAASMFIKTGKIMQYYLSGTLAEFRKFSPSKLIIARAHQLAIELGVEKLVLGGGVGSAQDTLFKFKSGFSSVTKPFYVTKIILNKDIFLQICSDKSIMPDSTEFFPAYRA